MLAKYIDIFKNGNLMRWNDKNDMEPIELFFWSS